MAGVAIASLWGCEGKSSRSTGPTFTAASEVPATATAADPRRVSAELRDRFLFDHNAGHFSGRTFRWVPPIPIHVAFGDPAIDPFVVEQFTAWEATLAGVVPSPMYQVLPLARQLPARGIFFTTGDLPEPFLAVGDAITPLAEARRGRAVRLLQQPMPRGASRRVEIPEIMADGQIQRCVIALDNSIVDLDDRTFAALLRHEVGHCLGFLGHVSSGLMVSSIGDPRFSLTITPNVSGMMRKLYGLAPGTPVTR